MYGQKQIIQCMVFVLLAFLLNYYKSIMRREKEQRQSTEHTRRQKLEELQVIKENAAYEMALQSMAKSANQRLQRNKMLEFSDSCPDLHVLIHRPNIYDHMYPSIKLLDNDENGKYKHLNTDDNNNNLERGKSDDAVDSRCLLKERLPPGANLQPHPPPPATKPKIIMEQIRESSSSIIYLMVLILLVSLGKAAYDLSKQFKAVSMMGSWLLYFHADFE